MNDTFLAALISGVGVLISACLAYLVGKQQIQQRYNERLYEKRIQHYPDLYYILSSLAKHLVYGTVTKEILETTRTQLDEWDSRHAVLLSPRAIATILTLRGWFREIVRDWQIEVVLNNQDLIREEIGKLEAILRRELGIYDTAGFHNPTKAPKLRDLIRDLPPDEMNA